MSLKSRLRTAVRNAAIAGLAAGSPWAASAAPYYWDVDGATAGAGGAAPGGTWGTGGATWSTSPDGTAATAAYTTLATDDLTFSAGVNATGAYAVILNDAQSARSLSFQDGTATIGGAGGAITLGGAGGVVNVYNGAVAVVGNNTGTVLAGTAGLTKTGVGTLTLSGTAANPLTGGLTVNGGTLALSFANLATPTDLVASGNALTLGGGGTLSVTGKATGSTSQALGNVTVGSGGGQILGNKNGGTALTVTLGSLAATAGGGSLLVGAGGTAANAPVITTTTDKDATGIYGGRVVFFNGTANTGYDWATTASGAGPFALSGYAGYATMATSGSDAANSRVTASATLAGDLTTNTLKFENPAATQTLALGGNLLTLTAGGLLATGTNAATVSGAAGAARLTAGNGSGAYDLVVHQFNSGGLTISAVIGDNGANPVTLVKAGTGTLTLGGLNTFTGGIVVNGGSLASALNGSLNNNPVTFNANATFTTSATEATNGGITLNNNSQVILVNNNSSFTVNGPVTGTGGLSIEKGGLGSITVNLTSTGNTFTGPIRFPHRQQNQSANLTVGSLADTAAVGEGNITFGFTPTASVGLSNSHNFNYGATATAPLTLNNRQFELATAQISHSINNNSGQPFTVNSDLVVSGTTGKALTLGGTGAGPSTFAGRIANSPNPTTGTTLYGQVGAVGATSFALASVEGIAVGATITATGIPAGATITAVNPVTRVVTISAGTTAALAFGATVTVPGVVNSVQLTKAGSSVWTLSGNNSFSGGLVLSGASAGSQLNINSPTALGTGTFTINSGDNAKIDNTSGGPIALVNNNPQTWSNNFAFVGSNSLNLGTGPVSLGGSRNVTVTASTLTVGGVIGSSVAAAGITKLGALGTLAFGGNNTYGGTTTVSAGTLLVNNAFTTAADSGTGTGAVSITATLGGTGQVAPGSTNAVTVGGGGTLAPGGGGIGTLTVSSAGTTAASVLAFTGTGKLLMELGAGLQSDRVAVRSAGAGDVVFSDTVVNFSDLTAGGLAAGTYTLVTADAADAYLGLTTNPDSTIATGLLVGSGLEAYAGSTLSVSGNNIVLNLVPEPGGAAVAALAGLGLLSRRRRSRRGS